MPFACSEEYAYAQLRSRVLVWKYLEHASLPYQSSPNSPVGRGTFGKEQKGPYHSAPRSQPWAFLKRPKQHLVLRSPRKSGALHTSQRSSPARPPSGPTARSACSMRHFVSRSEYVGPK